MAISNGLPDSPANNVAVVFGVTGVSGWAICHELVAMDTFSTVIGVCHRPVGDLDMIISNDKLQIVTGVDLLGNLESVVSALEGVEKIDHVYGIFASLQGAPLVCANPLVESAGRTQSPYREMDSHYAQCDEVAQLSKGKNWKYFEVRPDAVIGYIPRSHDHNFTVSLGLYLSMYAHVHGAGTVVRFPGTPKSYNCAFSLVSQEMLAKFTAYLAVHGSEQARSGEAFNISNGDVLTWSQLWPTLAATVGLVGVAPDAAADEGGADWDWPFKTRDIITAWEDKYGLRHGWGAQLSEVCFVNTMLPAVDRVLSLDKARALGFDERDDTVTAFARAWDLFRQARVMPPAPIVV